MPAERNLIPKTETAKRNLRIRDAKKLKIADAIYNEILEETLLQTRKHLNDFMDGMKTLRAEFNWQVRNNQRLEKVFKKI